MSKYLCVECKFNNNGWCKQKKMNGLKKLNIQECDDFKKHGTILTLERQGKDYYGQELMLIKINNEVAEIPVIVLEDFIKDKTCPNREIVIPD